MAGSQVSVALFHRDDPDCPAGPLGMMGDEHRVGCSAGTACLTPVDARGGAARGEFYLRTESIDAHGLRSVQARYLCALCGTVASAEH